MAGDSVQVRPDGIPVITAWKTQEVITESVDLVLEKAAPHRVDLLLRSVPSDP